MPTCTTGRLKQKAKHAPPNLGPTYDRPRNRYLTWSTYLNRLSRACARKCIPTEYREAELNKGESVCLDRCAAKFFEVHMKVSEIVQEQQQQQQQNRAVSGGGFGFGS